MLVTRVMRAGLVPALGLLLCGCSFGPRLQGVAINQNEMVAGAVNQMTVLNILRAKAREPLHFTAISRLNGSAGASAQASSSVQAQGRTATRLTSPAEGLLETSTLQGTALVTPALEAMVTGNSGFEVEVLDTQEFFQGFLASVPPATVAHYLQQGWPDKLLAYLLVAQVEVVTADDSYVDRRGRKQPKGTVVATIDNDPGTKATAEQFGLFVNCYRLASVSRTTPDHPLIPLAEMKQIGLSELATLDGEHFDVDPPGAAGGRWIRRLGRRSDSLELVEGSGARPAACDRLVPNLLGLSGAYRLDDRPAEDAAALLQPSGEGSSSSASGPAFALQLVLRSPDGAIYYLGEYLRHQDFYGEPAGQSSVTPLLVVTETRPRESFVSVNFHDHTYYVPAAGNDGGRSTQVIALIQQLVNLQKSADDKPSTATVRVLN